MTVCGAMIGGGSDSVQIGGPSIVSPGLSVASELPGWLLPVLNVVKWGGLLVATGGNPAAFYGVVLQFVGGTIGREIGGAKWELWGEFAGLAVALLIPVAIPLIRRLLSGPAPPRNAPGRYPVTPPERTLGPGESYEQYTSSRRNDRQGLQAHLGTDGILDLYIVTGDRTPRGGQMFAEAMAQFGENVRGVRGTWIGDGELESNYDAFVAAIKRGIPAQEAALSHTFTGTMASRFGFTRVTIVENSSIRSRVVVEFVRPTEGN